MNVCLLNICTDYYSTNMSVVLPLEHNLETAGSINRYA